jgi:hypothetical protein
MRRLLERRTVENLCENLHVFRCATASFRQNKNPPALVTGGGFVKFVE